MLRYSPLDPLKTIPGIVFPLLIKQLAQTHTAKRFIKIGFRILLEEMLPLLLAIH